MKKIKLITTLSTLGVIAATIPIVATSCSKYKGFIKSVDGSNLWVTQPGDVKVFMPMGKDMKPAQNVKWSIKKAGSLSGKFNVKPDDAKGVFGWIQIKPDAVIQKEETITVHAENDDKSYSADSEITIKPNGDKAPYSVSVDPIKQQPSSFQYVANMSDATSEGITFELFDKDDSPADSKWQWQVDMFIDASGGNVKKLAFDPTTSGKAILKGVYGTEKEKNNTVAFCSAINSETKGEITIILTLLPPSE